MRPLTRIAVSAFAIVIALAALGGCAARSNAELVADERPVPDGMPAMYEFYTTS